MTAAKMNEDLPTPHLPSIDFVKGLAIALERLTPRDKARFERVLRNVENTAPADLAAAFERVISPPGNTYVVRGSGLGASVSIEDGRAAIAALATDELSDDWARSELLGAGALAARLHIAAATLANWRAAGHIVAFPRGRRNYLYPVRQFKRGRPTPQLGEVVAKFAGNEDAWEWLVSPNLFTSGQPPLDRLQGGHTEEVMRAAEGALDFA